MEQSPRASLGGFMWWPEVLGVQFCAGYLGFLGIVGLIETGREGGWRAERRRRKCVGYRTAEPPAEKLERMGVAGWDHVGALTHASVDK